MLDPTEAPEGYEAVKAVDGEGCTVCVFCGNGVCRTTDHDISCLASIRKDKTMVTFKKKEDS